MRSLLILMLAVPLFSCTASMPFEWQDAGHAEREGVAADLEACRIYTARQYHPGVPAGTPYRQAQPGATTDETHDNLGRWRPDRTPFPTTNLNSRSVHNIPVGYTGYPGYLDYFPGYLDAILEKCMHDRGWYYGTTASFPSPNGKNPHQ
jgi:hypothetical protein